MQAVLFLYKLQVNQICFLFVGMNTNEDVKIPRLDQPLPSVSLQASYDSCSFHRSDTNDVEKASATHENKHHVKNVEGETKIDTFIKVPYQYQPYMYLL